MNTRFSLLSGFALAATACAAQAAPVFYDNEAVWLSAMQSVTLEDFNGQTDGAPYHTVPLDIGPFTISMNGGSTSSGRNQIDAVPHQFSVFDVDGTTNANVLLVSGVSLFLTFDSPISGFAADLASFNDDEARTAVQVASGVTTPAVGGVSEVRFFGVTSDTPFTTVEFRSLGPNDGFSIDNVRFGNSVPEPTSVLLAGLGLLSMLRSRRGG